MQSILQNDKACYLTGARSGLHRHHIFFGRGLREISEKNGLWVWLRWDFHNGANYGVHFDRSLDLMLKQTCQRAYERSHTRDEFIALVGRNYLE